jgi:hypothetical protein
MLISWGEGKYLSSEPTVLQPGANSFSECESVAYSSASCKRSYLPRLRPLYQTQEGQWRALSNGTPVLPGAAFSYISRSFKQTTPYILGALRLLALSYSPKDLNTRGWSLYADFRPHADGWGKRSEVKCSTILSLRLSDTLTSSRSSTSVPNDVQSVIHVENSSLRSIDHKPQAKKARTMTLEEYEAVLDNDMTFNDVNLDFSESSRGARR